MTSIGNDIEKLFKQLRTIKMEFWPEKHRWSLGSPHIAKVGRRTVHHEARFQSVEEDW